LVNESEREENVFDFNFESKSKKKESSDDSDSHDSVPQSGGEGGSGGGNKNNTKGVEEEPDVEDEDDIDFSEFVEKLKTENVIESSTINPTINYHVLAEPILDNIIVPFEDREYVISQYNNRSKKKINFINLDQKGIVFSDEQYMLHKKRLFSFNMKYPFEINDLVKQFLL